MQSPISDDDDGELQELEDVLRAEAACLLEHFTAVSPSRIASTPANPIVVRRTASLSTVAAGLMLCMFGGWLAMQPPPANVLQTSDETVEAFDLVVGVDTATRTRSKNLESLAEQFRDGDGRLPVLLHLVDDQGNAVGTGMFYPEQEVPVDFADLSPSEQQAAVRLLGLEAAAMPAISI